MHFMSVEHTIGGIVFTLLDYDGVHGETEHNG